MMKLNGTYANGTNASDELVPEGVMEFHTPSDHTFDGAHFDVELEILLRSKKTNK